jgi:hypothetical protein
MGISTAIQDPERTFSAILGSSEEATDGWTPRSRWFSVDREIDPAAVVSTQLQDFEFRFLVSFARLPRRSVTFSWNPMASRTLRTVEKFGSFSPAKAR